MDIDLFEYSDILNAPFQAFNGSWEVTNTHWHYFTEILYLKEGELEAEVLGTKYYLKPGDLIIFHPKQIHAFRNAQKKENLELIKENASALEIPITIDESNIFDVVTDQRRC